MSIFEEIDKELNNFESFWGNLGHIYEQDILENNVYSSRIRFLKSYNTFEISFLILTKTSLCKCNEKTEVPEKRSIISWKKVEPFTETNGSEERFGFKLGHESIFEDFYVNDTETLEIWLNELSKVCIMRDFEEDFAILKELGRGAYSVVLLAQNLIDNSRYAVKSIDKASAIKSSRGALAVVSEIEILKKLSHPSVISLYKVYENDTTIFLILEYMKGGDLFARINRKGKYTEQAASKFMKNLLETLKFVHSLNIVHRDLKPENILLCDSEDDHSFKLADFGLACFADDSSFLRCGSPGYIAPEILKRRPYDQKIDIFSAGIILHVLLTGKGPFYGRTNNEILKRNEECKIAFHDKDWSSISKKSIDLVLKLTEPDPEERISIEEALNHDWIVSCGGTRPSTLTVPHVGYINFTPPDSGMSAVLMKRINDKRQEFPNQINQNYQIKPQQQVNNAKAKNILKKLRESDLF